MTAFPAGRAVLGALTVLALASSPASAQDRSMAFRFGFGWQTPGGDLGTVLDSNIDAEFSLMVPVSVVRVGGGANWASFDVAGADASWSQIRMHLLVNVPFELTERVHPYVEGRWTYRHLRPEDDRYFGGPDVVLRDVKFSGGGLELVAGVGLFLSPRVSIDLSGGRDSFGFSPDLSSEGLGAVDSGSSWRVQAGVTWFPLYRR